MVRTIAVASCLAGSIVGCSGKSSSPAHTEKPAVTKEGTMTDVPEVAMPAKLKEEGWELVPKATYAASQAPGQVIIRAAGNAPTPGYEVKLLQSMLKIYPPQYLLYWKKPDGMVAQVVTPFDVTATFKAAERVQKMIVSDGEGRHELDVEQVLD